MYNQGKRKYDTANAIFLWILASEGTAPDIDTDCPIWELRKKSISASLSANTWRGLGTLYKKVQSCRSSLQTPLTLPWSEESTIKFVTWLSSTGMSPPSIKTTTNKIATFHEVLGYKFARPPILSRCLTGMSNADILRRQSARKKLAMTPNMMLEVRANMAKKKWPAKLKRMAWMALTMMMSGCLRVGEILPPSPSSYLEEQTPLVQDLSLHSKKVDGVTYQYLMLQLRCSKTNTETVQIEMVQDHQNRRLCPVQAYLRARDHLPRNPKAPLFSLSKRRYLSPDVTNAILKSCCHSIDWRKEFIVNHSLRR